MPPLFTEPGHNLHTPAEIGIDASRPIARRRSMYRTTPLPACGRTQKGGFYHDGRFATLGDVVDHYDKLSSWRSPKRRRMTSSST